VPYGYSLTEDSRLVVDSGEADVVRQIFAWVSSTNPTARSCASSTRAGSPPRATARGKRKTLKRATWYPEKISDVVRSELYAGRRLVSSAARRRARRRIATSPRS